MNNRNLDTVVILERPGNTSRPYYAWCKRCSRHVHGQAYATRDHAERAGTWHLRLHKRLIAEMADKIVGEQLRIVTTIRQD